MIKLIIEKIDGYNYLLKDEKDNAYNINIEFYDLVSKPNINDYIYMNENLVKNNSVLSFGPLDGIYGKNIESSEDEDLIILVISNEKIYLKRYYG